MTGAKPTAGLLPLYLKLYDDGMPQVRARMQSFYGQIAARLEARGLAVLTVPVCRLRAEFQAAVRSFEQAGAEAIVTLHLAYSPSLESADALARSRLPVIVCDTTPAYAYGPDQDPEELMYNHGIHGVQDLCNLLLRRGKPFQLEAGHWERSDVLDRVAWDVLAARMATHLRRTRAGLIWEPFRGMGDFHVPQAGLKKTIGIETCPLDFDRFKRLAAAVTGEELARERARDRERFEFREVNPEAYERSLRVGLAVEKWVEEERLDAFSFNFLSHMGELNWRLTEGRPLLLEMDYKWSDAANPVYLAGRFKPGNVLLINLAPMRDGYRLIVTPAEMLPITGADRMERSVRGWFRPPLPVAEFLGAYSRLGGTHHLALTYGAPARSIEAFGRMMGWDTQVIG